MSNHRNIKSGVALLALSALLLAAAGCGGKAEVAAAAAKDVRATVGQARLAAVPDVVTATGALEAGMPLYGHEIDEDTDPFTAGLGFAVSLDEDKDENGEAFIGQEALKKIKAEGCARTLIGIKLKGRRTPRQGNAIYNTHGEQLGAVTSGCLSPTLGYPIAIAYVTTGSCKTGDSIVVAAGSSRVDGEIVTLPFYKR